MRARQLVAALVAGGVALTGTLLAAPPGAVGVPPVLELSGTLTERGTGMPAPGIPDSQRIVSASVEADPQSDRAQARIVLGAEPTVSENAKLWMVLGQYDDKGTCTHHIDYNTPTHGALDPNYGWSRSGSTYTLDMTFGLYGGNIVADSLDCAFALVTHSNNDGQFLDILGGDLTARYAETKLQVAGATLLGSKKLKLLPKEWITVDVVVKNIGAYDTSGVVVTGKGKGVKVKKANPKTMIYKGSTLTVPVKVKLTKKAKAKVTLTAQAIGTKKVTRTFTIKPAKAPKRIQNGKYRSKDKRVTFQVKKGKITKFKVTAWALCGSAGRWEYYTLDNIKVPRSGIVNIVEQRYTYIATVKGRASGKQVKAKFGYTGGGCFANVSFTAHRIGK